MARMEQENKRRERRSFTDEFKAGAVALVPGLTAAQSRKWVQVIEIVIESPVSTEIGPVTTADWIFAGLG
jgi:hypothetical protein